MIDDATLASMNDSLQWGFSLHVHHEAVAGGVNKLFLDADARSSVDSDDEGVIVLIQPEHGAVLEELKYNVLWLCLLLSLHATSYLYHVNKRFVTD